MHSLCTLQNRIRTSKRSQTTSKRCYINIKVVLHSHPDVLRTVTLETHIELPPAITRKQCCGKGVDYARLPPRPRCTQLKPVHCVLLLPPLCHAAQMCTICITSISICFSNKHNNYAILRPKIDYVWAKWN